jgi:hypothetical protein
MSLLSYDRSTSAEHANRLIVKGPIGFDNVLYEKRTSSGCSRSKVALENRFATSDPELTMPSAIAVSWLPQILKKK